MNSLGHPEGHEHVRALGSALRRLEGDLGRLERWGDRLGRVLVEGGRVLVAGNGGSAAEAQHLTGELVGRYRDERTPLSAIALHAETSSLTAIGNDYGADEAFARQVRAHGRPGDVLVALSTSGASPNVVAAVQVANEMELVTWAMCGARSAPLVELCDDALCVEDAPAATIQEVHLVALHLLCQAIDRFVAPGPSAVAAGRGLA